MRSALVLSLFVLTTISLSAQQAAPKLYDPDADAAAELSGAVAEARAAGKHVLVQVGGNWCKWCIRLHKLMEGEPRVDSLLQADFVLVRVNYSKENRNLDVLRGLDYPQRFGFPVLLVLDGEGRRLHTQDSALLEKDGAHDPEAVLRFLGMWTPGVLAAERYR